MSAGSFNELIAGRGKVVIRADDTELVKGLNNSAKRLREFGEQIRGVGLGIAGAGAALFLPLAGAAAKFAEHGQSLELAHERTGESVEALSAQEYAAKETQTSLDALVRSIGLMDKSLGSLRDGSKETTEAFGRLRLTFADLAGLSQEDRLKTIAARLNDITDAGLRAQIIRQVFGRGGMEIEPLLARYTELTDRAKELGLVWSTEDAVSAQSFYEASKDLWLVLGRLTEVVGSAVAPVLRGMVALVIPLVNAFKDWTQRHRELFQVLTVVAAGFVVFGATLVIVGTAITIAATAMTTLAGAFSLVGGALAFMVSPLALIVVAVGAATAALIYFSGVGADLGNLFQGVFSNIWDLINFIGANSGTPAEAITHAFAISAAEISVLWNELKDTLEGIWTNFADFFKDLWDGIVSYAAGKLASLVAKIAFLGNIPGTGIPDLSGAIEALGQIQNAAEDAKHARQQEELESLSTSPETLAARAALVNLQTQIAKQFGASGEQSLADKFNKLLNLFSPISPGKAPSAGDFGATQSRVYGTFGGSNLGQIAGGGDAAAQTAKNTLQSVTLLQQVRDNLQKIYSTREQGVFN